MLNTLEVIMSDFSDYGERTTDDFTSKKRTAKLEAGVDC
jgi:hypothetical protein